MSAGDRDTLAELLAEHAWVQRMTPMGEPFRMWWECACGQETTDHRAHVADVIASSDWLREQRAEAWLQGHLKGMHHTHPEICDDEICPNPYRTTEDTDAH